MRYAVTLVFDVGAGKVPRGADVLDRMTVLRKATHRFSYCDGSTLTLVVDWSADSAGQAGDEAALATRLVWAQLTGADPGDPLSRRIRPLGRLERVAAGVKAPLEVISGIPLDDLLCAPGPRGRGRGGPARPGRPGDRGDEDDGGLAGVREPRRPKPAPPHLSAALDEPAAPLL
jgi:hypothetical protein